MAVRCKNRNKNTEITHEIGYVCDYVKILTAKEMFEELGWYLDIETNDEQIVYSYNNLDKDTFGFIGAKTITFDKEMESIYSDELNDISMLLLKAINKQVEELGWNNE